MLQSLKRGRLLRLPSLLAFAVIAVVSSPLEAADLTSSPRTWKDLEPSVLVEYLAVLYLLRAAFDVVADEDVQPQLLSDTATLATSGDAEGAMEAVTQALLAEGSYAIVSLSYLVAAGGANWPTDRSAASYEQDALNLLAALQSQWFKAVEAGTSLAPLLSEIDLVNAWTEGYPKVPAHLDRFGDLNDLVDVALASLRAAN